jgi:RNA polymerase sigma-70 factor (ECF subfamily)
VSEAEARRTAEDVARRSYGKLVAYLAARTRDVAGAEDALSQAFASALADWPKKGCPANPEAWLLTAARRKLIDAARKRRRGDAARDQVMRLSEGLEAAAEAPEIPDHRLGLMFACAHPAIDEGVRAPLMLQAILGLEAATIASAFLTSPAAMGQRLVRAKAKIRQAGVPFEAPERAELPARVGAVLDAVYAAFTHGWADPVGADVARGDLTEEALFLARLTAQLLPQEAEAWGLLALMLHAQARRRARRDAAGEYVPLAEQDPALWDAGMIAEAEAALRRASTLGDIGRFQLEAALQSLQVAGRRSGRPDWTAALAIYDALMAITDSPVVALNRALAVAEAQGPAAALDALPPAEGRMANYQPYWAVRAELLARAGDRAAAAEAYTLAIGLEPDPAVRTFLARRKAAVEG